MENADAGKMEEAGVERTGRMLGHVGLVPFVLLAIWLLAIAPDHVWRTGTISLLTGYGAVILSFLGGVRWGTAIARPSGGTGRELVLAMLPPLIGWLSLATSVPYAFALLATAFAAQGASDTLAAHGGTVPHWYGRLRMTLTAVVVATMILAFFATG